MCHYAKNHRPVTLRVENPIFETLREPSAFLSAASFYPTLRLFFLTASMALLLGNPAKAANETWGGSTGTQAWATGTNWSGGAAPGATAGTTNTDTASFNSATASTVTIDAGRNIQSITFDGAAGGYTIGSAGKNLGNPLLLSSGGAITLGTTPSSFLSNASAETFNAPLVLEPASGSTAGTYSFVNNSDASPDAMIFNGGISGGTTSSTVTLTLSGFNIGTTGITDTNIINGGISNGQASGGLGIVKSGIGTWVLDGANTFTGGVTLNAGTLSLGSATALGTGAFVINGGSLDAISATTLTTTNAESWNGDFTFVGTNALNLGTGSVTLGGNRTVTVVANTLTVGGAIGDGGNGYGLAKSGGGTLILSGLNTYTGATTVGGGTLQFTNETSLYDNGAAAAWSASNIIVNSGATLALNVGGTGQFTASDITTLIALGTAGGGFENGSTIGLDTTNAIGGNFTYSGAIANPNGGANALGLTKLGANTLTLSGMNTYTGATTVKAGTLQFTNETSLYNDGAAATWSASNIIVNSGATLALNVGGTGQFTSSDIATLLGLGTNNGGFMTGSNIGLDTTNAGGSFTYSGNIANTNGGNNILGLTKLGTGVLVLSGSGNTFSGGLTINDGTVQDGNANAGTLGAGNVTFGSSNTPTLDLNGNSATVGLLIGTGTNGVITNSLASSTSGLTVDGTGTQTFAGLIQNGGAGQVVALTIAGGTQILTGSNTYTGATTIDGGGTLNLGGSTANGSINSGSALILGGGTLSFTKTGTNAQTFNGTTINSGASFVAATVATDSINLGAITRNAGGTVGFTLPTTGSITTTTANTGGTILGGWATVNGGASWAVSAGNGTTAGAITALASSGYTASVAGTTAPGSTANVDFQASNTTGWNGQTINSLRFNTAAATTLTLATGQTLTDTTGGILVTPTVAANASAINGGTLEGSSGGELIINQYNTSAAGSLTIGSVIANNGTATGLTLSGGGTLILTGVNTYSGTTTLNAGTLNFNTSAALGTGAITFNGGTLQYAAGNTADISSRTVTINSAGGTINTNGNSVVYANSIGNGGNGTLTVGTGVNTGTLTLNGGVNLGTGGITIGGADTDVLVLNAADTYSGQTTLAGGALAIGNANALGNSSGIVDNAANSVLYNATGSAITISQNLTLNANDRMNLGNATVGATAGAITFSGTVINNGAVLSSPTSGATINFGNIILNSSVVVGGQASTGFSGGANGDIMNFNGVISDGAGLAGAISFGGNQSGSSDVSNINGANTYTGPTNISRTTVVVTSINTVNTAGSSTHQASSSLGAPTTAANGVITLGTSGTTGAGTLEYIGTGETTDRVINLIGGASADQAGGVIEDNSTGTTPLVFTGGVTNNAQSTEALTLEGTNTDANAMTGVIADSVFSVPANPIYTNIIKTQAGTWGLFGASTYSGATTINAGTLDIDTFNSVSNGVASSSLGAPTTAANGTIGLGVLNSTTGTLVDMGTGETTDRVIALTGNGVLDQSGTGNLKLTSGVTGIASTTGIAKTITLQGSTAGTGQVSGVISDAPTTTTVTAESSATSGSIIIVNNASALLGTGVTITGTGITGGSATVTAVNGNAVTLSEPITAAGITAGETFNITGGTAAATNLTKAGTGTWFLSGANTYSGVTTIDGGVLSTSTLANGGAAPTITTTAGGVTATVSSAAGLVVGQAIYDNPNIPEGTTIAAISGTTITLSSGTGVTAGIGIASRVGTANGLGISTNAAANLVINGGTLQYTGSAQSTDRLFTIGTSGGTLDASGSGAVDFTNTGSEVLSGTNTARTFTLTGSNTGSNTLAGILADNGTGQTSLLKSGSGTWVLSGLNTFSGLTSINAGTLSVSSISATNTAAQALGENSALSLASAGTAATLQYTGGTGTLSKAITVASTGNGTISNTGGGVLTLSGGIVKNGAVLNLSGGEFVVSGVISGSSANSDLNVIGGSTVGLTAANTYNGPTSVSGGSTLLTGVAHALPNSTLTDLTLGSASDGAVTNTLDLLGTSETVDSITALGVGTTNQIISSNGSATTPASGVGASSSTGNLTVDYSGSTTDTYSGSLGGSGSGTNFSLTKGGTGTLALTGSNTFTGGTTVTSGALQLSNSSGSATGSGALNVGAGATLAGTGISSGSSFNVTGTSSSAVATVLVGHNSAGDLNTAGVMSLQATGASNIGAANLVFNLSATSAGVGNQLSVGATSIAFNTLSSMNTTLTLNLQGSSIIASGSTYVLIAGTGTTVTGGSQYTGLDLGTSVSLGNGITETKILNSNFGGIGSLNLSFGSSNSFYGSNSFLFLYQNANTGVDDIEVEVVPEPGTWAMMLGGLALLILIQRRRNKLVG